MLPAFTVKLLQRLIWCVLLWLPSVALAWGPHGPITRAALDVLPGTHALHGLLGAEADALTNYCWIPDFKRLPFRGANGDFYCDDYLLFPGTAKHLDHICPEVRGTYEPYFRRALQAMRMETPENAARWVGSLLHFVQDSGSPPHAAQVRGDIHIKMETWIAATNITIAGYTPKLLGTNDNDAVRGLVVRMDELIEFARPRGMKLRTQVLLSNRRAVMPVALECANECARVSADVLHTLATLAANLPPGTIELSGRIMSHEASSDARVSARMLFDGTNIATLSDSAGAFRLRGISPGTNRLVIFRPGSAVFETNLTASESMTNLVFNLRATGELVRNSDFARRWVNTNAPDCWMKFGSTWDGEVLALQPGSRYRITAEFLTNSTAEVLVRWAAQQPFIIPKPMTVPRYQTQKLTAKEPAFTLSATTNAALVMLGIRCAGDPTNSLRRVSVKPVSSR